MKTADAELRRAEAEVRHAVDGILARSGCRIAEALATEIHQAYTGRFDLRPRAGTGYCRTHTRTRMPCGLCPPGV